MVDLSVKGCNVAWCGSTPRSNVKRDGACYGGGVKADKIEEARELFEAALRKRGITVVVVDGGYEIHHDGGVLIANIENVSRQYAQTGDPGLFDSFVSQIVGGEIGASGIASIEVPTWDEVRHRVYWSLLPRDVEIDDTLAATVSRELRKVLVWTDPNEQHYTFIKPALLATWGVTAEQVAERAETNQANLLEGKTVEISDVDGAQIGMIPVATGLKASAILASNFKTFVGDAIAWPVYVVVPCRDFALIFSQQDQALMDRVGTVTLREYAEGAYPLSAEVFAIDDTGIKAVGRFEDDAKKS